MAGLNRSALVPFSAAQMYALVNHVETYPEFVPWCSKSATEILSGTEKQATLWFVRGPIKTSFTTRNTLTLNAGIDMRLIDGPFSQLQGTWRFTDMDDHTSKVMLDLQFKLSNRLLKFALESFFNQLCDRLVSAFVQRANEVYKNAK